MNDEVDRILKIILIGESGVGKTAILERFNHDIWSGKEEEEKTKDFTAKSTVGVDFLIKKLHINGKIVKCQVWDTAGQERFANITRSYFKNADVIFICFDPTKKKSLTYAIDKYLNHKDIETAKQGAYKALVATKTDLNPLKTASPEIMTQIEQLGLPLYWTSAKTNQNINDLFNMACIYCIENTTQQQQPSQPTTIILDHQEQQQTTIKNTCC